MYGSMSKSKFKTPLDKLRDMAERMTHEDIAAALGVSRPVVTRALSGNREVPEALANALGFQLVKRAPIWEPIRR